MSDNFMKLFSGFLALDELPTFSPRSVTIFIISAFTDFEKEREVLRNYAYPQLNEVFRKRYGLQLRYIDLRLGLDSVYYEESGYWDLYHHMMRKLSNASEDFLPVILIGQKFGHPLLPKRLPTQVFYLIRTTLRAHQNTLTANYSILDKWYVLDENSGYNHADSDHVLVPTQINLPHIMSSNPAKKACALAEWKKISNHLASLIKSGIGFCLKEATLDNRSVFELLKFELDFGVTHLLMNPDFARIHPIAFEREIVDLKNYLNEEEALNYTDLQQIDEKHKSVQDDSLSDLLQHLNDRVSSFASIERQFSVLWRFPDGINENMHQEYLRDFCEAFIEAAKNSVELQKCKAEPFIDLQLRTVFDDVWTSLNLCRSLAQSCIGREKTVDSIASYCGENKPTFNSALVLQGTSTSENQITIAESYVQVQKNIMAIKNSWLSVSSKADEWVRSVKIMIRIVTFEQRLSDLVRSLYNQARVCFNLKSDSFPEKLSELFKSTKGCPMIIMVAGTELIVDESGKRLSTLEIVPQYVPQHVRIVLTSIYEGEIEQGLQYINIYDATSTENFLREYLKRKERRLSEAQWLKIKHMLPCISSTFHTLLLCNSLSQLKPADPVDILPTELSELLEFEFERLERKFGATTIMHSFSIISLSKSGITDNEISDILSLDEDVLNELLIPIKNGFQRFPDSLWLLIKNEIQLLIQEFALDGYFVVFWANEDVKKTVEQRYLNGEQFRKSINFIMADYFLGTWHSLCKPKSNSHHTPNLLQANRLVPSQDLFCGDMGKKFYNDRCFRQLPHHLILSDRISELYNLVLFNYDWIFYKSSSQGLLEALNDFKLVKNNAEVNLVEETLQKARFALEENLNNLASEISGNLVTYSYLYKNIKNLVRQADVRGCQHNIFVPTYSYPKLPGSALQSTVECPSLPQSIALVNGNLYVKLENDGILYKYDLRNKIRLQMAQMTCGEVYISKNESFAVIVNNVKSDHLRVHKIDGGEYVGQISPLAYIDSMPFDEKHRFNINRVVVGSKYLSCIVASRAHYIIIATLSTCQPVHVFKPEHRASLCDLSPNENFVITNNGEQVLIFEVGCGIQTAAIDLLAFPRKISFTKDSSRAFVLCEEEEKIVILFLDPKGGIEISYKVMFNQLLTSDNLKDIRVSQNEQLLLVRAEKNVLVYEFERDAVTCHIRRPNEIPLEFKMPNSSYESINFSEADFAFQDRVVVTSIFRDVLVWEVSDGKPLVMLHAPTGILTRLFIENSLNMLVGFIELTKEIHIWNLQGAFTDGTVIDCMTSPVKKISTSIKQRRAVACCALSDEMGVLDLDTGLLTDLYSHEGEVLNCAITSCGNYAIATVRKRSPNTTNIIWSLSDRKIVAEFGNFPGYLLPCHKSSNMYVIDQRKVSYCYPFSITRALIDAEGGIKVNLCEATIPFLLSPPFLTANDDSIVSLIAKDESDSRAISPCLIIWNTITEQSTTIGPNMLSSYGLIRRLLDVKSCKMGSRVAIIYSEKDTNKKEESASSSLRKSVMVLDLTNLSLVYLATDMLPIEASLSKLTFSKTGDCCVDSSFNLLYSMVIPGKFRQLAPNNYRFYGFALNDSLVIFSNESKVYAYKVSDGTLIGELEVHCSISTIHLDQELTLLVGTEGGNVLSYRIVNSKEENVILEAVRQLPSRELLDGERARSWDRVVKSSDSNHQNVEQSPKRLSSLSKVDKNII